MIPLLGVFLVVLTALSVHDVLDGAVGSGRLATHVAVLVGLLLLVALDRTERALPPQERRVLPGTAADDDARDAASLRTVA